MMSSYHQLKGGNREHSIEFVICYVVFHSNINSMQNIFTVTNSTMVHYCSLLPYTLLCHTLEHEKLRTQNYYYFSLFTRAQRELLSTNQDRKGWDIMNCIYWHGDCPLFPSQYWSKPYGHELHQLFILTVREHFWSWLLCYNHMVWHAEKVPDMLVFIILFCKFKNFYFGISGKKSHYYQEHTQ